MHATKIKCRRYMAEILPIWRKTLSNQSTKVICKIYSFMLTTKVTIQPCIKIAKLICESRWLRNNTILSTYFLMICNEKNLLKYNFALSMSPRWSGVERTLQIHVKLSSRFIYACPSFIVVGIDVYAKQMMTQRMMTNDTDNI